MMRTMSVQSSYLMGKDKDGWPEEQFVKVL